MLGPLLTTGFSFIATLLIVLFMAIKQKASFKQIKHGFFLLVFLFIIFYIFIYFLMPSIIVPNIILSNIIVGIISIPLMYFLLGNKLVYKAKEIKTVTFIGTILVLALPVIYIYSLFTLDNVHDSINTEMKDQAEPLSKEDTPIAVAPESARNKMQKAMSVVPNPQFYDLGKLQVQKIGDEIVYVAPLEFTGFWKFIRGQETEGYFTISATNINAQPEFVAEKMQYTNSSYLNKNVQRTIYNKYPQYVQSGTAQIEVDENGKPWYVQTLYLTMNVTDKPDLNQLKVAVVDPATGDVSLHDTDQAPDFIDGSVSSELASTENTYFGKYVHGWFNSMFGKKDVRVPNESGTEKSVTPIFDESGDMYYFTDMTSPKENIDSALGYTMINARTGKLTYYNGDMNNGIMDSEGAKQIVNKEYPEKNWEGSMPILYNIDGNATWVVNVLDPNGLFKQYAYINAADSDFVVFGETASQALASYRLALQQNPSAVGASDQVQPENVQGTVDRVLVTSTEDVQIVRFLLENDPVIYTVSTTIEPKAIFMTSGDDVELQAKIRDEATGSVESIEIEGLTN
ncbi:DNA-binding protein [Paraliobacillus ryukyuensis]|uniref:DNA-binding protein n=1 Tax=Paraliobacillus ryukyuensis TaxID=200904 RepID=UPI0009A7E07D|nr:DNA-binding protein [Paraliobacillus ryukyuensis]